MLSVIFRFWHRLVRFVRRALNKLSRKRFPIRFEDLTDEDAQMTAWMVGIPDWQSLTREELNEAWYDYFDSKTVH